MTNILQLSAVALLLNVTAVEAADDDCVSDLIERRQRGEKVTSIEILQCVKKSRSDTSAKTDSTATALAKQQLEISKLEIETRVLKNKVSELSRLSVDELPIGSIVALNPKLIGGAMPELKQWVKCDGAYGTPNLVGEFLKGANVQEAGRFVVPTPKFDAIAVDAGRKYRNGPVSKSPRQNAHEISSTDDHIHKVEITATGLGPRHFTVVYICKVR